MNTVKAIMPQTDTQAAIPQHKTKAQTGGADFRDMLSDAIGGMKNTREKTETTDNTERTADKTGTKNRPERSEDKNAAKVKSERPARKDEEPDEVTAENVAAQFQIQADGDTQPDIMIESGEIPVQAAQTVQAMPIPVQADAAQTETELPTQEAQDPEQAEPVQTERQVWQEPRVPQEQQEPIHTQTNDQEVQAVNTGQSRRTVQKPQEEAATQESAATRSRTRQASQPTQQTQPERQSIPEEAADGIVSTKVARQPDESFQATRQTVTDHAQTRFDEMLAKARQGLVQTRTVAEPEQQADIETADIPEAVETAETPAMPVQDTEQEPRAEIPEEDAAVRQTTETEREDAAVKPDSADKTEKPEKPEQKAARTGRTTVETDTNTVQPRLQYAQMPEITRTEQQAPTQSPRAPEQFEQVRAQVIQNLEDQKMEFQMQLHPQELGKVDVKMVLESGKLSVEIITANARSAEILNRQTEALVSSLKLGNLELTSVNVVTASENAGGSMDGEYNLGNFQNQSGRQDAQGSNASAEKRDSRNETAGQQEDETTETRHRGILNYSI